jgi:hypothetical protein
MTDSTHRPVETNAGLCFRDAIDAIEVGMISKEEYFEHLIAHYRGLRHPFDHERGMVYQLMVTEPVASSIRRHALWGDYEDFDVAEIEACQKLFHSCVEGNMGQFTAGLDELSRRHALILQPVTVLAAIEGHDEIFRLCVPLALNANIDIEIAVRNIMFKQPEIMDFLLQLNWEDIQNSPKILNKFITSCLLPGEGYKLEVLRWILDHGAKIPPREYQMMAMAPPRPDVLRFLLVRQILESVRSQANTPQELNPKGILNFGMLQYSAGSGKLPIVETLIEAGADVNKDPPDLGDIREPGPFRALWMAADAQGSLVEPKHIQTARVLLKNGADMNLPAGKGRNEETALQAAQRKGNAELLALFDEFGQH